MLPKPMPFDDNDKPNAASRIIFGLFAAVFLIQVARECFTSGQATWRLLLFLPRYTFHENVAFAVGVQIVFAAAWLHFHSSGHSFPSWSHCAGS
jgi:hypothetical protein